MNWLANHSTAIQALAAVATTFVTVVLVVLTGRYVRLTREIAASSAEQLRQARELILDQRRRRADASIALIDRIRPPLAALDPSPILVDRLASFAHLNRDDIAELEALARDLDSRATHLAGKTAHALRQLVLLLERATQTNPDHGWLPTEQDHKHWYESHQAALKCLDELREICRELAAKG